MPQACIKPVQKAEARDETAGGLHEGGVFGSLTTDPNSVGPAVAPSVEWFLTCAGPSSPWKTILGLLRRGRDPQSLIKNFAGVMPFYPALSKNWFEPQVFGEPDSRICRQRGIGPLVPWALISLPLWDQEENGA